METSLPRSRHKSKVSPLLHSIIVWLIIPAIIGMVSQAAFAQSPSDTARINRILRIADKTLNPDSAITLYNQAIRLSIAASYADGATNAIMTKGIKYYEKEDYQESRRCCFEALPWAARSGGKTNVAWCYNNIGISYFNEGDYASASRYFYTALDELKKLPPAPTAMGVNVYNNLGLVNARLNQADKAMVYFNQAEQMARKANFGFQLASSLVNKGEYYLKAHQPGSAQKCFDEVMSIGVKMGKVDLQAYAYNDLGKTYTETGSYAKAIASFRQAIALARNRFNDVVIDACYSLGDAYYRTGKYQDAESNLLFALSEMKAHNIRDSYIDCYARLRQVYQAAGQYQKALDCMDSLVSFKDSLTSAEKARAINTLQVKYETAEKDKRIATGELLIARQKSKIISRNIWIASIAGALVLLAILVLIVYRNALHRQRLSAQQAKTGLFKAVVDTEEKERARIARDLHDGIGGMLSVLMLRLVAMSDEQDEITRLPAYHLITAKLGEIGVELRKTAHNLMPEVLLKQSLPDALRSWCDSVQAGKALQVDFQSYGLFDIPYAFKLNIYRIVQELLKNITQHAHAGHALVQLMRDGNTLTVTVEDDGIGFNKAVVKDGIGLRSIETRVKSLEGNFTLDSTPGKGTTVFIEFEWT